ncbi:MAG: DUF3638 domain-containing protein, partial [Puniceicoccales bacterium]|nr:DUF3638 domain-containing protein [Puniceicoccales bacterium]
MLLSLDENSKDGIAFPRQDSLSEKVIKNVSFGEQLQSDFQEICGFLSDNAQGKIAQSKYAKRFPFLEHCHLPTNGNFVQKAEAMFSWLQTSGNVNIFDNLEMQRMFCKLLCGDANNPQALVGALKDRATREQFVHIVNQFFKTAIEDLPSPVKTEADMQKYKFYASLHIQLNETIKKAGGPELEKGVFDKQISPDSTVNEGLNFACVLCKKMINVEKLTADEILKCTDQKMMIWPEMAGANDTLLERDPEDSSGIKNMFEKATLEVLRNFIIDQVNKLEENDFQEIGREYSKQPRYEDHQVTVDVDSKLITIKDRDNKTKVCIDLNNFVCLIDGKYPEEYVKEKKEEHLILAKLGIDGTNIHSRVKVDDNISTVDGKIIIDNRTNKVTMDDKVLVTPKPLPPNENSTVIDLILSRFLPFAEETDTVCKKIYFYDPMSLNESVFVLEDGKLHTSNSEYEYKFPLIKVCRGSPDAFCNPLLQSLSCNGETKTNVFETTDDSGNVLSLMMPDVHYNNQVLQFNRGEDNELHLASNEQYVLSKHPEPNPLGFSGLNYICLRSKENPSDYKFILINNKNLIDSSSIDNRVRQEIPILRQDVLEIGFNPITGFELSSSNYQATGIILARNLFNLSKNECALDILNKINMREVVAGRNSALLSLVFRPLITDTSKGSVLKIKSNQTLEQNLVTFKIITLLFELDPYNFRNLLLAKDENGTINTGDSFELIMQISSLYQSFVDAKENSMIEVNISKENESTIMEEIMRAMWLAMPPNILTLLRCIPEGVVLNRFLEYGLLKLFEQNHQASTQEFGTQTDVKYLTKVKTDAIDHEIIHYQPGGTRSFKKASEFSSVFPTRKTEMVAKLRREARETALLQLSSSIERRKIFLVKCCRKDNDIYADTDLSEQQKRDYIAFRKAMDFPQFTDDVIINSVQEVFISEIEGFLSNQSTDRKHSKALNIESVVRKSILDEILQPVKAPQIDAQHSIKGTDLCTKYKIDILLDVVQWDERVIQSNEALTKNDKQLILAFKKKHANTINNPEFKAGHESELLDLANAISGQNRAFSSSNRKEITQYNSTAEEELGRYNEEMSLAGSQDLRARALGELYEIKAESFLKTEGEEKSLIESTIDSIANQIETAKIEETENSERLKEIFSNCSRTMASLRQTKLAKTPNLNDAIKALVCAPSDPEGDWSKSVKILQDINPEFTIIDCKEIVDLARQQLQASTAIKSMEQLKTAVENVRDKGKALLDANQEFPTHGATDLTPEQKDFTSAKDQLIAAYESVRTYNPKTEMEELAFEGTVGFRVRGAQANIVKNVTAELQANEANNEQTGVTFQLMMGGGKTSVILSQLAHIISQQHRIPLFVCHPSQYTSMSGNLRLFQESRYSQEVISIGESKSDLQDSSKLLGILRKLKRAKDGGGCLVIQAPTLRAIKLEFIRTSRLAIESKDPAVMVRAKQLANILSEIKENCVQLLDEIDLNLDISKSVNFPSGARKPLARSQIDVIASMLDLVTQEPELYKAFCGDKFRVEKDGKIPIDVFKQKVVDGCFDQIQKLDSSIKKEDFQKFMLGTGKPNEDFEKAWKMIKKKYPEQAEKIALQNGMLSIVDSAAKNEYNRHYGFREDGAVIPYQGVGTPSSGEFGNVYEQAYYFFAAVLHNGIQLSQMTSLVEKYIDGSISESSKEQLESLWNSSDLGKLSDLKRMSDAQRNAAIQKTTEQLNQNKTSPYFMSFAKILAANAVNYSPQSLEGDAISMIDITKTSIGCTGTPWNRQTYHSAFQGDNKAILEPGTEGKIIQKWQKDFRTRTSKILTPEAATVSSVLEAHKKAHVENSENLRALVDAGGIFKDKTNEEVARDILKYYRDDTNVQSVVYLGKTMTGEESFFVMQRSDPSHPVPIPNTSPQEIEKVVGRGNIGKTFTYFDELRCTGCDIPLDKNARAILTTNPDTTPIRTVLQGILRARKFLDSQTVDLCVLQDSMPSDVNVNTDEPEKIMAKICSRCIENQSAMLAKQTYKSYRAQISNCLKSILFERLHESISKHDGGKISKKEQRILDLCNKFIYSSFEANPLELFGGFTSEQKAYDALRNYYESILANIEKEDKSIAKEFQDRAEKILNQSEKVLNFSVQEGVFDAGTEVEAETETEMEQEREQERVTEDSSKVTEETSWDILNVRVSTGNDVPTTAEASVEVNLEESGQVTDNAPQAPKSLEERTKMMIDDFQSVDFTEGSTLKSILESQEDNGNTTDLVDQRLQAVAKKNGVSDRELLLVLNESYNNEEGRTKEAQLDFSKRTLLSKYVSSLIDKTKTRILGEAPTFASLIAIEGTSFPRILSVNECVASKTDQLIFKENVQITANLANNAEGVKWMDDSQRKDAQFVLVYKTDDETFKT